MVVILGTLALSRASAQERPQIEFIQVPAGTFTMGYNPVEVDTGLIRLMNIDTGEITFLENERPPQRLVNMQPFKMSKYEITFEQYDRFCEASFLNEGSLLSTVEVGSYAPNNFGLFDRHGNVAEWCDNNGTDSISFPKRGGSWSNTAEEARSWVGGIYVEGSQGYTNIGFRIVCDH